MSLLLNNGLKFMKAKLFIVTTVPITLKSILSGQPRALSQVYDVSLISSPSQDFYDIGVRENVDIYSVPMSRGITPIKDLYSIFAMVKVFHLHQPDIIHSYTPKAGLITMIAGLLTRVPVRIHTFTGLLFPTSFGLKKSILKWIDWFICKCSTHVVPEGSGVKSDLISYKVTDKPLNVIGNGNIAGIDTGFYDVRKVAIQAQKLKNELGIPHESFIFCFVGRFTQDKGIHELVGAFLKLPEQAHLILVGSQDERLPLSDDVINILNQHSRIHQTGWLSDIRPPLAISNVFVLPSYREGFPNTPLQAGSMGLPSIVSNVNGCNEIIQEGLNGWIVPPGSMMSLYEIMLHAMGSTDIETFGFNARQSIESKFEKSAYMENLKNYYSKVHDEKIV